MTARQKPHSKTQIVKGQRVPPCQPELEQQYIHLQTILMLAQFNATYHELVLAFRKATDSLENQYKNKKIRAFLKLKNYKCDSLQIKAREIEANRQQKQRQKLREDGQLLFTLQDEGQEGQEFKQFAFRKMDSEAIRCKVAIQCKSKLTMIFDKLKKKRKNCLSFAYHKILVASETNAGNILSEKSSRIDTSDSQKSKIFKRSVERQQANRKSFSLQKDITNKKQYFVPVKYQRSKGESPSAAANNRPGLLKMQKTSSSSSLNKFLQDRGEVNSRNRRNLMLGQNKMTKSSSSNRLNLSQVQNDKQQKARQLQYLRSKYKKLMDQFHWFSDRFLKVIQEEDNMQ